ncbi:MAG: alanine racemase [Gammaproteobacteria bacterium]|nr:alanine racemase [Gammaproteobacteria bacterium]
MTRATEARLDLAALRSNLQRARELSPNSKMMAIIKANAYGHGLVRIGRALMEDTDAFGVASGEEAWALRMAGIQKPINLLEGFFDRDEFAQIEEHELDLTIHHVWQVNALAEAKLNKPVNVWLKLDSGMHRLGLAPDLLDEACDHLMASGNVASLGYMTHLANADDEQDPFTNEQVSVFDKTIDSREGERNIANSAGIIAWPDSHREWARPGIMLYGVSPMLGKKGEEHGLKPVMTLRSRLIAVNYLKKGDRVGYGGTWECPEDMPVGVVAIGYGDGYPRHAREGTPVRVRDQLVPLIGRVSMDMITVDLRRVVQPRVGDEVTLWGEGLPIELIAEAAGTIGYELLCGVTPRVRMVEA